MYPANNMMFSTLSDDASVWLYAADRRLDHASAEHVQAHVNAFRNTWRTHGREVVSDCELIEHRLLVVAAEVPGGSMSGCGIDKSLHTLDNLARELGFTWVSGLHVVFLDQQGQLQTTTRPGFRALAADGTVNGQTPVVDLAAERLGEVRRRGLHVPLSQSWHAQFLDTTPAGAHN